MIADRTPPLRGRILRRLPPNIWAIIILAVLGLIIYLIVDHGSHTLTALPYVGILLFAGMHLFGHGGHGGHGGGGQRSDGASGQGGHAGHGGGASADAADPRSPGEPSSHAGRRDRSAPVPPDPGAR